MYSCEFVYDRTSSDVGSKKWTEKLFDSVNKAVITELQQIQEVHKDEKYLQELIDILDSIGSSGGCYIATAVYGSYDCPEVWTLRRFRDYVLGASWYGQTFIKFYYFVSPAIVKYFGHTNVFQTFWRKRLDKFVKKLNDQGVSSTPYVDRKW